eukprot:3812293-Pyramimonas_sp.AAC.1
MPPPRLSVGRLATKAQEGPTRPTTAIPCAVAQQLGGERGIVLANRGIVSPVGNWGVVGRVLGHLILRSFYRAAGSYGDFVGVGRRPVPTGAIVARASQITATWHGRAWRL